MKIQKSAMQPLVQEVQRETTAKTTAKTPTAQRNARSGEMSESTHARAPRQTVARAPVQNDSPVGAALSASALLVSSLSKQWSSGITQVGAFNAEYGVVFEQNAMLSLKSHNSQRALVRIDAAGTTTRLFSSSDSLDLSALDANTAIVDRKPDLFSSKETRIVDASGATVWSRTWRTSTFNTNCALPGMAARFEDGVGLHLIGARGIEKTISTPATLLPHWVAPAPAGGVLIGFNDGSARRYDAQGRVELEAKKISERITERTPLRLLADGRLHVFPFEGRPFIVDPTAATIVRTPPGVPCVATDGDTWWQRANEKTQWFISTTDATGRELRTEPLQGQTVSSSVALAGGYFAAIVRDSNLSKTGHLMVWQRKDGEITLCANSLPLNTGMGGQIQVLGDGRIAVVDTNDGRALVFDSAK